MNETDENESYLNDIENLNENIIVEDNKFDKYDKMLFNPLRYENMSKEAESNVENIFKVSISNVPMLLPKMSIEIFQRNMLIFPYST